MSSSWPHRCRSLIAGAGLGIALAAVIASGAHAGELSGAKTLTLHGRDGRQVVIGRLHFEPRGDDAATFRLDLDREQMKDHFLSMREFKCADGDTEILCHVPYPYAQPATVRAGDFRWLEHSLLFLYKQPRDFGARLRNGIYFQIRPAGLGWVGVPQAVDLTLLGVPPDDLTVPPYRPAMRDDIADGSRWVTRLTID